MQQRCRAHGAVRRSTPATARTAAATAAAKGPAATTRTTATDRLPLRLSPAHAATPRTARTRRAARTRWTVATARIARTISTRRQHRRRRKSTLEERRHHRSPRRWPAVTPAQQIVRETLTRGECIGRRRRCPVHQLAAVRLRLRPCPGAHVLLQRRAVQRLRRVQPAHRLRPEQQHRPRTTRQRHQRFCHEAPRSRGPSHTPRPAPEAGNGPSPYAVCSPQRSTKTAEQRSSGKLAVKKNLETLEEFRFLPITKSQGLREVDYLKFAAP